MAANDCVDPFDRRDPKKMVLPRSAGGRYPGKTQGQNNISRRFAKAPQSSFRCRDHIVDFYFGSACAGRGQAQNANAQRNPVLRRPLKFPFENYLLPKVWQAAMCRVGEPQIGG
ncbi:MAG: hypothetical protein EBT91_03395 [Rhodobacteraceae bacterium]|nr:hypothetical protein [Paracoccaceae bacterium]